MTVKKYVKKQVKRAGKYLKKRYTSDNKIDMDKVVKDLMYVKGVLNVERKYLDRSTALTTVPGIDAATNWVLHEPDLIAQGDTSNSRDGQQVRAKSLHIKGEFVRAAAPTAVKERIRMWIFIDKEPLTTGVGSNPPRSNFMQDPTNFDSMTNWNARLQKRFRILYTKTFTLDSDNPNFNFNVYKRMGHRIRWADGTLADNIQENKLYIAFECDQPNANATRPGVSVTSRITYIDN